MFQQTLQFPSSGLFTVRGSLQTLCSFRIRQCIRGETVTGLKERDVATLRNARPVYLLSEPLPRVIRNEYGNSKVCRIVRKP